MFSALSPAETGIHFSNRMTENDSINILDNKYISNGGVVGIADFNKDGLHNNSLSFGSEVAKAILKRMAADNL